MSALTIYVCGTAANATMGQHLIPWLHHRTNHPKAILTGVGGGDASKGIKNPGQAGTSALSYAIAGAAGNYTGAGISAIVEQAIQVIRNQHTPIARINLAGFSRGAVACLHIAEELRKRPETQRFNNRVAVFNMDPVAGGSLPTVQNLLSGIPGNISHYRVLLQEHDDKGLLFRPLVHKEITGKPTDQRHAIPMPGDHGEADKTDKGNPIPAIVRHLAMEFLSSRGTLFTENTPFHNAPKKLMEAFALAKLHALALDDKNDNSLKRHRDWKEQAIDALSGWSDRRQWHFDNPDRGPYSYCVNWYHRDLFRSQCKRVYDMLGEKGNLLSTTNAQHRDAIAYLQREFPQTHLMLTLLGFIFNPAQGAMPGSHGGGQREHAASQAAKAIQKGVTQVAGAVSDIFGKFKK